MASITEARDALGDVLEATGLRVYRHEPLSFNDLPCLVVKFVARSAHYTLTGQSYVARFVVTAVMSTAHIPDAQAMLDEVMSPDGAMSVERAVEADRTWGGRVGDGHLIVQGAVTNVGIRRWWQDETPYLAADFNIECMVD